ISTSSASPVVDLAPPITTSAVLPWVRAYTLPSRSAARNSSHFGSRVPPSVFTAASRLSLSSTARSASALSASGDCAWLAEGLAVDGLADGVDVEGRGLLDGLLPDVDAEVARLHRVVGHALAAAGQTLLLRVLLERVHELLVVRVLDGLEVVPRREVADQGGGVHAAQLVLGHAVRHDRRVLAAQPLVGELLVEGHVAVAVDRRQHARAAARGEAFDLADDRLVVLVAEGRVLLLDVRGRHALRDE